MKAVLTLALPAALLAGAVPAEAEAPCLRSDDALVKNLVTRGLDGSETFRQLFQQLEDSNLIVHLRRSTKVPPGSAYNQFITYAGSYRFVRITLNVDEADNLAVALLGHELRHAVELAEAPAVEDSDDYQRLYDRIGYESCSRAAPRCYETEAAGRAKPATHPSGSERVADEGQHAAEVEHREPRARGHERPGARTELEHRDVERGDGDEGDLPPPGGVISIL